MTFSRVEVWIPSNTYPYVRHGDEPSVPARGTRSDGIFHSFLVRLAPGATFDALQAELDVLTPTLAERYPDENEAFKTVRARVYPGLGPDPLQREGYATLARRLALVGAVLLLLGCANVANMLIARAVRRQHERALRMALGASRGRLVRLQLTDSCLLAVGGAVAGIAVAVWLKELMQVLLLPGESGDISVPIDTRVLTAALLVSLGCGLTAGVAPAWIGSTAGPTGDLARGGARAPMRTRRLRTGLAAVQLALSLALLVNALLLVATLGHLSAVDVGFDPQGVSIHGVSLDEHGYTSERALAYGWEILERLESDPLLTGASLSLSHPFGPFFRMRIADPAGGNERLSADMAFVTGGHFETLGIRLLAARTARGHRRLVAVPDVRIGVRRNPHFDPAERARRDADCADRGAAGRMSGDQIRAAGDGRRRMELRRFTPRYSARSVASGSAFAARRAGHHAAKTAVASRSTLEAR